MVSNRGFYRQDLEGIRMNKRMLISSMLLILINTKLMAAWFGQDPINIQLPDMPVPKGASWYWIGERMSQNGMPMSVKRVIYSGDIDSLKG